MSVENEGILAAYRNGDVTEEQWRAHLSDKAFAKWLITRSASVPAKDTPRPESDSFSLGGTAGQATEEPGVEFDVNSYPPTTRDNDLRVRRKQAL